MKNSTDIKKVAIIGAGTMGLGIAQVFAQKGYATFLFDLNEAILEKAKSIIEKNLTKAVESKRISQENKTATLSQLSFTADFSKLKADLIVEAIIEKLDIKQKLFHDLALQNDEDTILATNTSSIPITQIARGIPNESRVVGMHFFNPAHIMKLVEVISGASTDKAVADCIYEISKKLDKTPVYVKDSPGFIVNRVARHYYVEALKTLEEQVTSFETIDKQMESLGFKMGPFKLMDLIGVDTNFSVTSSMFASFHQDSKFRPSRIQQQKVDAGHHGIKTKKGFYTYE
jgi:3-hydroxybutyryl-CoA dehydrogenase